MDNYNNAGYELNWDSEIQNDSPEFILLPEGEYDFEVERFERGRHEGSAKLPPCNKATVYLKISAPEGETTVKKDLYLHSKCEGLLCSFFACIGQRQHGQKMAMNWNAVPGARGRLRLSQRLYNGNTYNEVKRFLEPQDQPAAVSAAPLVYGAYQQQYTPPAASYVPQQQTFQQPAAAPNTAPAPALSYTPGKF